MKGAGAADEVRANGASIRAMAAPTLAGKLVVAISSRALFDLAESHRVYTERGVETYHRYQIEHEDELLAPGPAFALVTKLLRLNRPSKQYVEVILLSRNSADTGLRVFNAIKHHDLDITRAAFTKGRADVALRAGVRRAPLPFRGHRRRPPGARGRLRGRDDLPERFSQRNRRAAHRIRRRRRAVLRRGRARVPGGRPGRFRAERGRCRGDAAVGRAVQGVPRGAASDPGRFPGGSRVPFAPHWSRRAAPPRTSG